ncbi:MAG: TetR/AcrR family transcriptional regulator [Marinilabiliaceae bacterium]|nr:TetR/AcrR family transcriptional regulator [Marinilabiliaceae bacterium]
MQTQKDNIRQITLDEARREFLDNGFKDTSMRTIAKNAGVGLSNIYNYFKNKDELFLEVLKPLLSKLKSVMAAHNSPENLSLNIFESTDYQRENIDMFVGLVEQYRPDLKLLLYKAYGSSLQDFRETFTNESTIVGMEYLYKMKEKYPHINANISEFFIHTMSSWWLTIMGEIVTHNLTHDETEQFITEYMTFGTAGWHKLMCEE